MNDVALRIVDQQLDDALRGLTAPPRLTSAVLRQVQRQRPSRLPEILDSIGWAAVVAIVLLVLLKLTPVYLIPNASFILASVGIIVSLGFGVHSAQSLTRRN